MAEAHEDGKITERRPQATFNTMGIHTTFGNSRAYVGRFTYGFDKITVMQYAEGATLLIGSFCSLAPMTVFLGGNHRMDYMTTFPFGTISEDVFDVAPVTCTTNGGVAIGHDVWIGMNATIMSGVTIGSGAVIAANSHVVKNVMPYEVVGGNPARHIKYRFSPEIIKLMQDLAWWDLPVPTIREIIGELCSIPSAESLKRLIQKYKSKNSQDEFPIL